MNLSDVQLMQGLARNVSLAATSTTANPRQFKGLVIEYVGANASTLITVASTTLVSVTGAAGAEAADANFTVGGVPGTIDLTNAAANTAGELVDFINNLTDYKARLVGLRRADVISGAGYFVAASTQQAKGNGGYAVNTAVAVALHVTAELSILDGNIYSGHAAKDKAIGGVNSDYARQSLVELMQVDETLTYTGAAVFEVIEVDDFRKTDEVIYSGSIPGATTVAGTKSFGSLGISGITGRPGTRLLVRFRAASTLSAVTNLVIYGKLKSKV